MHHPPWLVKPTGFSETVHQLKKDFKSRRLHTVCEEARCPNLGECWSQKTATFMILGDRCTRHCGFCSVTAGRPGAVDPGEPEKIAEMVALLGLRHVVITCVARDDLDDGGAGQFVKVIKEIRKRARSRRSLFEPAPARSIRPAKSVSPSRVGFLPLSISNSQARSDFSDSFSLAPAQRLSETTPRPGSKGSEGLKNKPPLPWGERVRVRGGLPCTIEVLTTDFGLNREAMETVCEARPDVFNHNLETVERLTPAVRHRAGFRTSLEFLRRIKEFSPSIATKSGIMVGLGETKEEVVDAMRDLREVGCEILTIGQYLRPTLKNLPVVEYVRPEVFQELEGQAYEMGFRSVASGPFVRSSYHAGEMIHAIRTH